MTSRPAAVALSATESVVARLARFFPHAISMRIPVRLSRPEPESGPGENTVIEFGTPQEVLFASKLPLEFSNKVRLTTSDGCLDAEATVVAVRYHNGQTAVAARFVREPANWIVKR